MQSLRQYRQLREQVKDSHDTSPSDAPGNAESRSAEDTADHSDSPQHDSGDFKKVEHLMVDWDGPQDPTNPRNWPLLERAGILCIIWVNVWALDWAGSADSQANSKISTQFHVSEEAETLSPALYTFGIGTGALVAGPISGIWQCVEEVKPLLTSDKNLLVVIPSISDQEYSNCVG